MERLTHQVRKARRRLLLARFVGAFVRTLLATMLVATAAIAVPKLVALPVDSARWPWFWIAGAVGVSVVVAALWTKRAGAGQLGAAIEIDLRYDLQERISSAVALGSERRHSAAGQALIADAARAVERIDVAERFPLGIDRTAVLPLLPGLIALLLVALVPDRVARAPAEAGVPSAAADQVRKSTDRLRRKLIERRQQARQKGLKDAEQLLRELEQGTRRLEERKNVDKKTALVQLNDLARQLEKRRRTLGGDQSLRKHLARLQKPGSGPADRLARALRKGDFRRAAEEVKQLARQIRDGKLDARSKAQMAAQLAEMAKALRQLAAAHQTAMDKLQAQIERARTAGDLAAAEQLQQALDKLSAARPEMDRLDDLGKRLGMCGQCAGKGDRQAALDALGKLAAGLGTLQEAIDEAAILDDALAQIAVCKGGMACRFCGGTGCQKCQDRGNGLGPGRGSGPRPEKKTDTKFYDSQVRQEPGKGRAVVTDLVAGPNVRGHVLEAIQAEIQRGTHRETDPLIDRRLPRAEREHAQEFFDRFRRGEE